MTTTLMLVLDPPPAALHDDDPVGWTAGYVRGVLIDAGLVVHDVGQHVEYLLGVTRPTPPAEPAKAETYECPMPWCRKQFEQQHHVKMHLRSHQERPCRHCGVAYKLTGLHSHERACAARRAGDAPAATEATPAARPAPPQRERVTRPPRQQRERPAPPQIPDLGPITRRKFDPDRARVAAAGGAWGYDT